MNKIKFALAGLFAAAAALIAAPEPAKAQFSVSFGVGTPYYGGYGYPGYGYGYGYRPVGYGYYRRPYVRRVVYGYPGYYRRPYVRRVVAYRPYPVYYPRRVVRRVAYRPYYRPYGVRYVRSGFYGPRYGYGYRRGYY
jgi:hypothetical protein